jgi:hypothetical protein
MTVKHIEINLRAQYIYGYRESKPWTIDVKIEKKVDELRASKSFACN